MIDDDADLNDSNEQMNEHADVLTKDINRANFNVLVSLYF